MLRTGWLTPYLYLAPMLALLGVVFGYPLVAIFDFSTRRIRGASGPFIGLENFRSILKDDIFQDAIRHNGQLLLLVPVMVTLSLLLAVLLYDRVAGWRVYRTLLFLPFILAVPVVALVFGNMFQLNGVVNQVLRSVGLRALALDWIGSSTLALWTVMGVIVWRESGFGIVLFLARLLGLNEELYDAARIDGAGWWQRLWYVTVPQMRGVIEFYAVVSVITMLAWVFSYVYTMTHGGPGNATQIMELYIYNYAFRNALPGVASAVAVILFLVTLLLMLPLFQYRLRDEAEEIG
jgi:ABC-type sugar transport system permease subunit